MARQFSSYPRSFTKILTDELTGQIKQGIQSFGQQGERKAIEDYYQKQTGGTPEEAKSFSNLPPRLQQIELQQRAKSAPKQQADKALSNMLLERNWHPSEVQQHIALDPASRKEDIKARTEKRGTIESFLTDPFRGPVQHPYFSKSKNKRKLDEDEISVLVQQGREQGQTDEEIIELLDQMQVENPTTSFNRVATAFTTQAAAGASTGFLGSLNPAALAPTIYDFGSDLINKGVREAGGPQQVLPQVQNIQNFLTSGGDQRRAGLEALRQAAPEQYEAMKNDPRFSGLFQEGLLDPAVEGAIRNAPLTAGALGNLLGSGVEAIGGPERPKTAIEEVAGMFGGLAGLFSGSGPATLPAVAEAGGKAALGTAAAVGTKAATGSDFLADIAMLGTLLGAQKFRTGAFQEKSTEAYEDFFKMVDEVDADGVDGGGSTPIDTEVIENALDPLKEKMKEGNPQSPQKQFINKQVKSIERAVESKSINIENMESIDRTLKKVDMVKSDKSALGKPVKGSVSQLTALRGLIEDITKKWNKEGGESLDFPVEKFQKQLDSFDRFLEREPQVSPFIQDAYQGLKDSIETKQGNIRDLTSVRRDLNSPDIFDKSQKLKVGDDMHDLRQAIDKGIEDWGQQNNPEALKQFRHANDVSKALNDTKLLGNRLKGSGMGSLGFKKFLLNLIWTPVTRVITGVERFLKHNPAMSRVYVEFIKELGTGDIKKAFAAGGVLAKNIKKKDSKLYKELANTKPVEPS